MNERILKLAQQTDVWCDQNHFGSDSYDVLWEEKFAELIVNECMKVCKDVGKDVVKNASSDYQEGRLISTEVCHNQIKKHFGVQE